MVLLGFLSSWKERLLPARRTLIFAVGYGALAAAIAVFFFVRAQAQDALVATWRERASETAELVADGARGGVQYEDTRAIERSYGALLGNPLLLRVGVFDTEGKKLAQHGSAGPAATWSSGPERPEARRVGSAIVARAPILDSERSVLGSVELAVSVEPMLDTLRRLDTLNFGFVMLVVAGALFVAMNLRAQARLQEALVRSDRLASLGTVASGVAHEVNNPLAFIRSNLEYVMHTLGEHAPIADAEAAAEVRLALTESIDGAERIRKIVADLRVHSRADDAALEAVALRPAAESALRMVAHQLKDKGCARLEIGDLPPVHASDQRLVQVLVNLLSNAIHALPQRSVDQNEIGIRASLVKGKVHLMVHDNGSGIPPKVMAHLFEPFFTTKQQGVGTGLGLSLCRSIVKSFGGTIAVESAVGVGTTFTVVLDVARSAARPASASAPAQPPPRRARLLVVDDEAPLLRALKRDLGALHDVVVAGSGPEALELLKTGGFDVVLCDLMMPGMSGMELHAAAAKQTPALAERFVFMTGGVFNESGKRFLATIPNTRFEKPLNITSVAVVIGELAHGGRGSRTAA